MTELHSRSSLERRHPHEDRDSANSHARGWADVYSSRIERPNPSVYQPGQSAHEFVQKHLHGTELYDSAETKGGTNRSHGAAGGDKGRSDRAGGSERSALGAPDDTQRKREVHETGAKIADHLKKDPHDFKYVFGELDALHKKDPAHLGENLREVNDALHEKGLLKGMSIVRDNRDGHEGWAVVAEDKSNVNPKHNRTMVSTSHEAHESSTLKHHYSSMHYRRGHYNGWHQSVEGGGGGDGGFDKHAVGGHVPPGARRELIEKALQLAGVPVTEQNISAVNKIVTRESGWNPNITNNWDINAKRGHPSTGLMQTIPSTFSRYALPGMNNNIHDPLSNLVAGIRYAEARYGRHGLSGVAKVASRPGGY
jgi:hypothetical protein